MTGQEYEYEWGHPHGLKMSNLDIVSPWRMKSNDSFPDENKFKLTPMPSYLIFDSEKRT